MSIWRDLQDRSSGEILKSEDFHKVYPGSLPKDNLLDTGTYRDQEYMIFTCGRYPYICVDIDRNLSVFAGAGIVKIDDKDGKQITLERTFVGARSIYKLELCREEDYVVDDHDGKQYDVDMLKSIAKDIIDQILKCEDNIEDRLD